ncbi:MAG TPA: polysaccharide biosynthesis C-terminal domain-containing protein [Streptosporangiaceae bacterium]|nr:polysaccharide biosynthesis C-terminal domain-containing protein [Streptosporangiaceae bacterium]
MTAAGTASPAAPAPGAGADLRSFARGGALSLVGAAVSTFANVGLVVLITRGFSKAEAGVFFAATSVFLLALATAQLGTQTGLVYFISRFRVLDQRHRIGQAIAVALTPVGVVGLLLAGGLFAFATPLAHVFVAGPPGHFATYLRVLAICLPLAVFADPLLAATRGFRTQRPTVMIENIGRPLTQVALTLLVIATASTPWLGLAWALPYLPAALLAWLWLGTLSSRRPAEVPAAEPEKGMKREFWRYTWPQTFTVIAQIALQRAGIVLVAALSGPAQAAVFTAATRFLVVGQLANTSLGTTLQPQLAERLALGDRAGARTLFETATAWLVLIAWPLYLLCAVFAAPMMAAFGRGYAGGTDVIYVLTGAMLVASASGMVNMVLSMAGRTSWNLVTTLLGLAANLALNVILIPHLGVLGAALAWAAAILINNIVPLALIVWSLRIHPYGAATLVAGALAALCFGALPFLARALLGDGYAVLAAATAVGTILYGYGCWRFRKPLRLGTLRALRSPARRSN